MEEPIHPEDASLDSLINWLRSERKRHPDVALSRLLEGRSLDTRRLVDLACIDLIERRRQGQAIRAESYAEQFPQLRRGDLLLDLIDAEICVAGELQQPIDPSEYPRRFPELARQIEELLRLESLPASHHQDSLDPSASFSVELVVQGDRDSSDALPMAKGHPILVPEWFSAEKCFASGPGRWLIRGRDSLRGMAMAMKVIQLSPQLHLSQSQQILDACESASKVRNPIWVPPSIAAIQRGHLGVIRPWIYAVPWLPVLSRRDVPTQLGELASLAFCLEAAHRVGATHGAIHGDNILLDHDGKLHLVDAVANREGMRRWLDEADEPQSDESQSDPSIMSLHRRKLTDTEDMIRLIASIAATWRQPWAGQLFNELAAIAEVRSVGAVGAEGAIGAMESIGQTLMRYADLPPNVSTRVSSHVSSRGSGLWSNVWKKFRRS